MQRLFLISTVLVLLFTLCFSFTSWGATANAATLSPAAACQSNEFVNSLSFVNIDIQSNSHCGTNDSLANSFIANCDLTIHNAQADTWQTRQTSSGGTRYNETGRSGLVTYQTDCTWYYVQGSYLTSDSQLLDPSYGCAWLEVDNLSQTLDYQCSLFPQR